MLENSRELKKFLAIFYIVGIIGFALPQSRDLFTLLIPLALILNYIILVFYHQGDWKKNWVFVIVYLLGYVVEVIGVKTGLIFGIYHYGNGLGLKLAETPLLIGMNWLMLVYATAILTDKWKINILLKVLTASLLMVIYDVITEQTASLLGMWYWQNNIIPLQNYMAWFVVALVMHTLLRVSKIRFQNSMAVYLLILQTVFFLCLFIMNKL